MSIYVIQRDGEKGLVKIGFTTRKISVRAAQIGVKDKCDVRVLAVASGDRDDEKRLHDRFATHHVRGEWFSPHSSILEFAASLGIDDSSGAPIRRITITLEDDVAARLERQRVAEDRPEAQMAVRLIKEALEAREKPNG